MADISKKKVDSKVNRVVKATSKAPKVSKKSIAKKKAPAKKKTVKKSPSVKTGKAVSSKAQKHKAFSEASKEQYFYLNNGAVVKSINQLALMMDEISDELFNHHVNDDKHDFANWINDVFEEAELAKQLFEAERHKEKNHYIVLRYVVKGK